jgi:hypothetical protein
MPTDAGDIREQLAAALDEAEKAAKACGEGVTWSVDHRRDWESDRLEADCLSGDCECCVIEASNGMRIYDEGGHDAHDAYHIARWDPATVLRLIAPYREVLDEHRDDRPGWRCSCSPRAGLLCRELRRAAAFWLGTPEVSGG